MAIKRFTALLLQCIIGVLIMLSSSATVAQKYVGCVINAEARHHFLWSTPGEDSYIVVAFNRNYVNSASPADVEMLSCGAEVYRATGDFLSFTRDVETTISVAQFSSVLSKSIEKFTRLRPDTKIQSVSFDLGLVDEFFLDLLSAVRRVIPEMRGEIYKSATFQSNRSEISIHKLVAYTTTDAVLKDIGLQVGSINALGLRFQEHRRRPWSELLQEENYGITRASGISLSIVKKAP